MVECVEDAGEDAVDDAGLTIVPGSGSGNLNLPPKSAGATMDGWLFSSGEQPIPLLPPMIFGEDAVDDGEDAVGDAGQTTGPGAGGVNPIPQATTATGRTSTWGRSIAHDPISEGNCVFLSFEIETSGGGWDCSDVCGGSPIAVRTGDVCREGYRNQSEQGAIDIQQICQPWKRCGLGLQGMLEKGVW